MRNEEENIHIYIHNILFLFNKRLKNDQATAQRLMKCMHTHRNANEFKKKNKTKKAKENNNKYLKQLKRCR